LFSVSPLTVSLSRISRVLVYVLPATNLWSAPVIRPLLAPRRARSCRPGSSSIAPRFPFCQHLHHTVLVPFLSFI
jgi:hypothetical protein